MIHDEVDILYVEDDAADIELTLAAMRCSKMANTMHTARDGAEAPDFIFCRGSHKDREFAVPKLVILDLKLPKVDGLEALRAIRSDPRTEFIPIVILTSSKEQRDLIDSYKLHVNSYVQSRLISKTFSGLFSSWDFTG
jgi:CheY-like chemotaxis protein